MVILQFFYPDFFEPRCLIPIALRVLVSCYQCLPYKKIYLLAEFEMCPKSTQLGEFVSAIDKNLVEW